MTSKKLHIFIYIISFILLILIGIKTYKRFKSNQSKQSIEILSEDIKLAGEGDIIFGDTHAELPIYLFGNYRCKYCIRFFREVLPRLIENYGRTVKVVLKPIPFSSTKEEKDALLMAISVFKYGNYKSFHELLVKDPEVIFDVKYEDYLVEIMNLNTAVANSFLDSKTNSYIVDNKNLFRDLKLKGTPAFVIGNTVISGYIDYNDFEKMIANKLNNTL